MTHLYIALLTTLLIFSCSDAGFVGNGTSIGGSSGKSSGSSSDESNISSKEGSSSGTKSESNPGDTLGGENGQFETGLGSDASSKETDKCEIPQGIQRSSIEIAGEDFPNNPFDEGGFDNDDYSITFSGNLIVDDKRIGSDKAVKVSADYSRRGTNCHHKFEIRFRKCPNHNSTIVGTVAMDVGSASAKSIKFDVPKKTFIDINLITTQCQYPGMKGLISDVDLYKSSGQFFSIQ